MGKIKSLFVYSGCEIGRLIVLHPVDRDDHRLDEAQTPYSYRQQGSLWECKCTCGKTCFYSQHALERQMVKSCGCFRMGMLREHMKDAQKQEAKKMLATRISKLFRDYQHARKIHNGPEELRLFNEIAELHKRKEKI